MDISPEPFTLAVAVEVFILFAVKLPEPLMLISRFVDVRSDVVKSPEPLIVIALISGLATVTVGRGLFFPFDFHFLFFVSIVRVPFFTSTVTSATISLLLPSIVAFLLLLPCVKATFT